MSTSPAARPGKRQLRVREPRLLGLLTAATLVIVAGIVFIGETGDAWLVALVVAVMVALAAALALDVGAVIDLAEEEARPAPARAHDSASVGIPILPGPDFAGPRERRRRVIVVTSRPVAAAAVVQTLGSPADLGVMVVSPEGFGRPDLANDERHYASALRAEETTVASLRHAGILAAGHVGDHDPIQAIEDARALFGAERAVVLTHRDVADAYHAAIARALRTGRIAEPPEIVDLDRRPRPMTLSAPR